IAAARLLIDDGEMLQAGREYERALRVDADHPDALEGKAMVAFFQGDHDEATRLLEGLIARAQDANDLGRACALLIAAGEAWLSIDPHRASDCFQRATTLAPARLAPLAGLVRAAQALRNEVLEHSAVQQASSLWSVADDAADPQAVTVLRRAAARASQDTEEAVQHLQAALQLAPDDVQTLQALRQLYADRDEPVAHARTARLLVDRAVAEGDWDDAASVLSDWLEASVPASDKAMVRAKISTTLAFAPAHRGLLDAFIAASESAEDQIEALERRLQLNDPPPVRAGLFMALAATLEAAQRTSDAARAYEQAATLAEAPEALHALLRIYRGRDEPERLALVLARLAAVTDRVEVRAEALTERAFMLARVGRDTDALASVQSAFALVDPPVSSLALAAKLAHRLGQLQDARRYAEQRAHMTDSGDTDARRTALLELADIAEAQRDATATADSLAAVWPLLAPGSVEGRQVAARLASALARAERFEELAELARARGRIESAPTGDRAAQWLEAARLSMRLNRDDRAASDVNEALALVGDRAVDASLRAAALEVQEQLAERNGDAVMLAEVIGRRAAAVIDASEQIRLRLEQSEVLEAGGYTPAAMQALKQALYEQPDAFEVALRLGQVAVRADDHELAADAFARAAQLADGRGQPSLEWHGRAASAFMEVGAAPKAATHDRTVLAHTPVGERNVWFDAAVERLEALARRNDDILLWVEILGRRAAVAPPAQAARLLLQRAQLESERLNRGPESLDALRRARSLAPEKSDIRDAGEVYLTRRLGEIGHFAEQVTLLSARAEQCEGSFERASLLLESARVSAERLGDIDIAMARINAAVRADDSHQAARDYRLALLRRAGSPRALAEALAREASDAQEPLRAAELMTEAAALLVPVDRLEVDEAAEAPSLEKALSLVQTASSLVPGAQRTCEMVAAYARALGRRDQALDALGLLVGSLEDPGDRGAMRIVRSALYHEASDPRASPELLLAYVDLRRLSANELLDALRLVPVAVRGWLGADRHEDGVVALLSKGLYLTQRIRAWNAHLRLVEALLHRTTSPGVLAELYTRAGDVFTEHLIDATAAEAAYRSAQMMFPGHGRSNGRLKALLFEQERFEAVVDAFGVDALLAAEAEQDGDGPARRRMLDVLSHRLSVEHPAYPRIGLVLADLELLSEPSAGAERLRMLIDESPAYEEATRRLLAHYEGLKDHDGYCDTLRRRAQRLPEPQRAPALMELADEIEIRTGDITAAERELRAALDADPAFDPARRRLTQRWLAGERF
ncbi:MAG: hypothetical protein AAF449_03875, partial [Myxococcota bacterium]